VDNNNKKRSENRIKKQVKKHYKRIAESNQNNCCSSTSTSCCRTSANAQDISQKIGYSPEELTSAPEDSNLGLGCGNPQAIANLKSGEVVLDLGCGGGFDCFLAAKKVGRSGYVIGVDMTPEMITRARRNAEKFEYYNVDFRLGELENLPLPNNSVDVIISNCVINLSSNKQRVFNEAFRVLKAGGRLAISDIVSLKELPQELKQNIDFYAQCISGATTIDRIKMIVAKSGFKNIVITIKQDSSTYISEWVTTFPISEYIASATIQAIKPVE